MSSAICFILDESKIVSSGNGLKEAKSRERNPYQIVCARQIHTQKPEVTYLLCYERQVSRKFEFIE